MDDTFDPLTLNDPVATQTDWSPLKHGGSNFCTKKLVEINPHRIEFKASIAALLFSVIFPLINIAAIFSFTLSFNIATTISIGLVFVGIGSFMLYLLTEPIVFEKRKQAFWRGRKINQENEQKGSFSNLSNSLQNKITKGKNFTHLRDIYALQIIDEFCRGNKRKAYFSYELNLVLKDGKRLHVVDHGNKEQLLKDAETLSRFLGIPVWNGANKTWETEVEKFLSTHSDA